MLSQKTRVLLALFMSVVPLAQSLAHPPIAPSLEAHSQEFERKVYKVTEGVYQAVGFALANSIMIEGDDGIIIVDVTVSVETAQEVLAEFRKITDKPVKALIYTHNHADHVLGGKGFVPDGDVPVYAHSTTNYYINRFGNIIRPIVETRSARMFGTRLPEGPNGVVNDGIGPFLAANGGGHGGTVGLLRPNKTFDARLQLKIAGVDIELVHAPGETNDQLFVWLPKQLVLLPGDNLYKAFPNLYTIRGTLYRDPLKWVESLDKMRALKPAFIAPSHTRPISGEGRVAETLTAYRDAIQYVHDQTIRWMNAGLTPDEIVERVQLPAHLKNHPFLLEHYGTVAWSVRSIFSGYLGWFSGDAASLNPVAPSVRAQRVVDLAGGRNKVIASVNRALKDQDYAWAAELAGHLVHLNSEDQQARNLKAEAFEHLGALSVSPNGRNFYLTQALELRDEVEVKDDRNYTPDRLDFAKSMPIGQMLKSLPVNLNAEAALDLNQTVELQFDDIDETYSFHIRQGVAEMRRGRAEAADLRVKVSSDAWADILLGVQSVPAALITGDVKLENRITDVPAFISFLLLFQPEEA